LDEIRQTTVFTTHTPVPAGHDAFPFHLVEKHLAGCWGTLGSNRDRFLALGAYDNGAGPQFNMTALAPPPPGKGNAVRRPHGRVTQSMWKSVLEEGGGAARRTVASVTNGVHIPTWINFELSALLSKYLGNDWLERHDDETMWDAVLAIPDAELWDLR